MPEAEKRGAVFLCDGETESAACQAHFSEHATETLTQLSETVAALDPTALAAAFSAHRDGFRSALSAFGARIKQHADRIPLPRSIFLGEAERRPAFRAVCHLLSEAETEKNAFSERAAALSALVRRIGERQAGLAHVRAALFCTAHADAEGEYSERLQALQSLLLQHEKSLQSLSEAAEQEAAVQSDFCRRTLLAFFSRMGAAADLANAGTSCDPRAILRLCGELSALIEALLKH